MCIPSVWTTVDWRGLTLVPCKTTLFRASRSRAGRGLLEQRLVRGKFLDLVPFTICSGSNSPWCLRFDPATEGKSPWALSRPGWPWRPEPNFRGSTVEPLELVRCTLGPGVALAKPMFQKGQRSCCLSRALMGCVGFWRLFLLRGTECNRGATEYIVDNNCRRRDTLPSISLQLTSLLVEIALELYTSSAA